jgi:multidrug transporter EmrE-like cation transporter
MIWIGAVFYSAAFLGYIYVLRLVPLSLAHPVITAGVSAVTALVAVMFFREQMLLANWIGLTLICAGIFFLFLAVLDLWDALIFAILFLIAVSGCSRGINYVPITQILSILIKVVIYVRIPDLTIGSTRMAYPFAKLAWSSIQYMHIISNEATVGK